MAKHAAPKRKKTYEDDEYAKFLGRAILAMERRASEDPVALAYFMDLQDEMRDAINRAGVRLHNENGWSLRHIARLLSAEGRSMTPQNAIKRWGPSSVARSLGLPSITERINRRRKTVEASAQEIWGDELSARRAARAERKAM